MAHGAPVRAAVRTSSKTGPSVTTLRPESTSSISAAASACQVLTLGSDASMDAITLLRQDHKTVKGLFGQFDKAGGARQKKRDIVDKLIEELSVHAAIE